MSCNVHANNFQYTCDDCANPYTLEPGDVAINGSTYDQADEFNEVTIDTLKDTATLVRISQW